MDSMSLDRRVLIGGAALTGLLVVAPRLPVVAQHHGGHASQSDPWLATSPYDGAVYLSWISADPVESSESATPGASGEPVTINRVYVARSDDQGQTFGEPVLASGDDSFVSLGATPAVTAFGPDGAVYIAWLSAEPHELSEWGREVMKVARSDDGTAFGPAVEIPNDEGIVNSGGYHGILVDPDGRVYVAWLDFRDTFNLGTGDFSTSSLRVSWSDDRAESFAPSVEVKKPACPCCPPTLWIGGDGNLYLAWRDQLPQDDGSDPVRDPMVTWSTDRGATWSDPVLVHQDGWQMPQCPHSGPGFVIDEAGRLHMLWYTGAEGRNGVYYAVASAAGEAFGEPIALLQDEWVPVTTTRLALGPNGEAYAAYTDGRNDPTVVTVSHISAGGEVAAVSIPDPAGSYPAVTVAGDHLGVTFLGEHEIQTLAIPLDGIAGT